MVMEVNLRAHNTPPNWRVAHPCATYKKELKNCYDHPSGLLLPAYVSKDINHLCV